MNFREADLKACALVSAPFPCRKRVRSLGSVLRAVRALAHCGGASHGMHRDSLFTHASVDGYLDVEHYGKENCPEIMMLPSLSPQATYKPAPLEGGVIGRGIRHSRRNNKIVTASLVISPGSY